MQPVQRGEHISFAGLTDRWIEHLIAGGVGSLKEDEGT